MYVLYHKNLYISYIFLISICYLVFSNSYSIHPVRLQEKYMKYVLREEEFKHHLLQILDFTIPDKKTNHQLTPPRWKTSLHVAAFWCDLSWWKIHWFMLASNEAYFLYSKIPTNDNNTFIFYLCFSYF